MSKIPFVYMIGGTVLLVTMPIVPSTLIPVQMRHDYLYIGFFLALIGATLYLVQEVRSSKKN